MRNSDRMVISTHSLAVSAWAAARSSRSAWRASVARSDELFPLIDDDQDVPVAAAQGRHEVDGDVRQFLPVALNPLLNLSPLHLLIRCLECVRESPSQLRDPDDPGARSVSGCTTCS